MTTFDSATTRWRRGATCMLASAAMIAAGSVALAGSAGADTSGTVYVSVDGRDGTGCGTSLANQCATIQEGVDRATAGETVQVAAGTYHESVVVSTAITLQGAGAGQTILDGSDQPSTQYGTLTILNPGGDVTVDGFTVQNPVASSNGQAFDVSVLDTSGSDTLTFTNNTLLGDSDATANDTNYPGGIVTANVAATLDISDNLFSGLYQATLVEGSSGTVGITDNVFEKLSSTSGDGGNYPAEGVFILSDAATTASTTIHGNTFRDYGGIGIQYRAGYDLGGCADRQCDGNAEGSITGNTFDLSGAVDPLIPVAALRLQTQNAGNTLDLAVSGNTGTVVAPTKTIIEDPKAGSITITPGTEANTIVPTPAPSVSVNTPTRVVTGAAPVTFAGSATNNSGEDFDRARYDVRITGTSGIAASQITLLYDAGQGYQPVPLEGTAASDGSITGYFGPQTGFPFPSSATPKATTFKLSVASGAPSGTLTAKVSLDEVSSGTGNPVLNTLATNTTTTFVGPKDATTVAFTTSPKSATDADVLVVNATVTSPAGVVTGGSVKVTVVGKSYTGDLVNGKVSIPTAKLNPVPHTVKVTYSGTDTATSSTVSRAVTVAKTASTLAVAVSPAKPTTTTAPKLIVTVTSKLDPNGAQVGVAVGTAKIYAVVANGKATLLLPKLGKGKHTYTVRYFGTSLVAGSTKAVTVTVTA